MSTIEDEASRQVAQAVREQRERLGLSLRALAVKSGISTSMISDVERGTKSPTIATLSALARGLGVTVATLVAGCELPRFQIVRASEQVDVVDPVSGARRRSFGPTLVASKIEFMRYVVRPHTIAGPFEPHGAGTIEHMHLAAGRIDVTFGADQMTLETGDSCSYLADAPHRFDNRDGDAEALIYIVVEHP
jgi:transcriptional regulator with XRE-family HTH domain